jgi:hypothetical protein
MLSFDLIRAYALIIEQSESMSGTEILVSGATGRTGGAAIAELIKMGRSGALMCAPMVRKPRL